MSLMKFDTQYPLSLKIVKSTDDQNNITEGLRTKEIENPNFILYENLVSKKLMRNKFPW